MEYRCGGNLLNPNCSTTNLGQKGHPARFSTRRVRRPNEMLYRRRWKLRQDFFRSLHWGNAKIEQDKQGLKGKAIERERASDEDGYDMSSSQRWSYEYHTELYFAAFPTRDSLTYPSLP